MIGTDKLHSFEFAPVVTPFFISLFFHSGGSTFHRLPCQRPL